MTTLHLRSEGPSGGLPQPLPACWLQGSHSPHPMTPAAGGPAFLAATVFSSFTSQGSSGSHSPRHIALAATTCTKLPDLSLRLVAFLLRSGSLVLLTFPFHSVDVAHCWWPVVAQIVHRTTLGVCCSLYSLCENDSPWRCAGHNLCTT